MKLLVLLLPIACFVVAFWAGKQLARSQRGLSRKDQRELEKHRDFMYALNTAAGIHSMLGDDFAVIVQGMLQDHMKSLHQGREK